MELTKEAIDKRNRKSWLEEIAYHRKWLKENSAYAKWLRRVLGMVKRAKEYDEGVNKIIEEENIKGGKKVMKLFSEFSNNEEGSRLEVYCYALKAGEVDKVIPMLEEKGFELTSCDSDSLQAKKEGNYKEVLKVRRELEKEGFSWCEK